MTTKQPDYSSLILKEIILKEQLDQLEESLDLLREITGNSEIDLILDQPKKSPAQKVRFLEKVIEQLSSVELQSVLKKIATKEDFAFFEQVHLSLFIANLKQRLPEFASIALSVAVHLTPEDLHEMAETVAEKVGQPVVLDLTVDPELVGGARIHYGKFRRDNTLKSELDHLRGRRIPLTTF